MHIINYIRKKSIKYILKILWQYKIDILFQKIILFLYKNKELIDAIVLESHNDFDSNSGAFYDYLIRNGYNKKYKIIWLIRNKKPIRLPANVKCLPLFQPSIQKAYFLVRAKYIVTCNEAKGQLSKQQKTYYLTHGSIALKAVKGNLILPDNINYYLCPSEYIAPIMAEQCSMDYPNDKQIILGYPFHDYLYNKSQGELLKITSKIYSKVILWMPTFRKNYSGTRNDSSSEFPLGIPIFNTLEEFETLNYKLKCQNALLILKIHPMQDMNTIKIKSLSNIIVLDGQSIKNMGVDNYKLMRDTNALISDYSSVAYDYLHMDNPIAYTLDDAEDYKLGFIIENPKELMAGHLIYNKDDFNNFINDVLLENDPYKNERQNLSYKIFKYHDGNSCKRLAKHMGLNI